MISTRMIAMGMFVSFVMFGAPQAGIAAESAQTKPSGQAEKASPGSVLTFSLRPEQKIMGPLVHHYRPMRIALGEKPVEPLKAEPKYLSKKPRYGVLELGTGPRRHVTVVVDEAENEKPRIYIDRNNDKDLTNDGPGDWTRTSSSTLGLENVVIDVPYGDKTIPYTFEFYRFRTRMQEFALYYRNACRVGEITLGGKSYQVAVLDDNADGRFDDLENGAWIIDLNRDGKLDGNTDSAEYFPLTEPVNIHGQVWEVASLSADGTTLALRPSTAKVEMKAYLDPGCPAPPFKAKDLDDKELELKSLAGQSQYVLLDFWASWCGPCRAEFPNFREIYARYKNQGLKIIGVNLDSDRSAARKAAEAASLEYPHVFDGQRWKNAVAALYRVHGIPATFLLDKDLKIVAKNLRGPALKDRLRELLGPGDEGAVAAMNKRNAAAETPAEPAPPPSLEKGDASRAPPGNFPSGANAALLQERLRLAYEAKLANPKYLAWKNRPGSPVGYDETAEEARIKTARAALSRLVAPPQGTPVSVIPLKNKVAINVDGQLAENEWAGALEMAVGPGSPKTRLFLISDGKRLFVGCDAPADTTEEGYDQFRFYIHTSTSPLIVNERVHVSPNDASAIRQTTVKWSGDPPANENERWKKYPLSDWNIYRSVQGGGSFVKHRQYEFAVDLSECGLYVGTPFPAFVEVEADPVRDSQGRFVRRTHIGELGSQPEPVWFVIRRRANSAGSHTAASPPPRSSGTPRTSGDIEH